MIIPKKARIQVYQYLFKEGVITCKKDPNAPKHHEIEVPNLYVMKLMQSFKSRGYVKEQFNWRWFYFFLTDEGIVHLREYLHLPAEIVPATLKKQRAASRPEGEGRPPREEGGPRGEGGFRGGRGGFRGERSSEGGRPGFGDRGGFRGGRGGGAPRGEYRRDDGGAPREGGFRGGRGGFRGGRGGAGGDAAPAPAAPTAAQ